MAVVSAEEHWEGRDGSFAGIRDSDVSRHFLLKTDNKLDDQFVVKAHVEQVMGLSYLEPHPVNSDYTIRNVECTQKPETPIAWDVTVDYSTEPFNNDEIDQEEPNPTDRPARISWSSEFVRRFTTEDKDGEPLWNTAADPYEPQEVDHVRWSIEVRKNVASVPAWVTSYVNRVNSSPVSIGGVTLAVRTLKCNGLSISEEKQQNDFTYYELVVSLSYDPDKWDLRLLSAGFRDSNGDKILDNEKDPVTTPWPLDSDGFKIDSPTAANVEWQTFRIYKEADLNNLPLS